MSGSDALRPARLLALGVLLAVVFLLLLVMVAVRLGPGVLEWLRGLTALAALC
jgi:hypothetical protein